MNIEYYLVSISLNTEYYLIKTLKSKYSYMIVYVRSNSVKTRYDCNLPIIKSPKTCPRYPMDIMVSVIECV